MLVVSHRGFQSSLGCRIWKLKNPPNLKAWGNTPVIHRTLAVLQWRGIFFFLPWIFLDPPSSSHETLGFHGTQLVKSWSNGLLTPSCVEFAKNINSAMSKKISCLGLQGANDWGRCLMLCFGRLFFFFLYYFPGPDQSISNETSFLSLESRQILDIHNGGRVFFYGSPISHSGTSTGGGWVKKQGIAFSMTLFYMLRMASWHCWSPSIKKPFRVHWNWAANKFEHMFSFSHNSKKAGLRAKGDG